MVNPFLFLYEFFIQNKKLFFGLLLSLVVIFTYFTTHLSLKEDITAFIPKDKSTQQYKEAIANLKFNDRLIVNVYLQDTLTTNADLLTEFAEVLVDSLNKRFEKKYFSEINYKINEETGIEVFNALYNNLPYYLTSEDYKDIETKLSDSAVYKKLDQNYTSLISSEGAFTKQFIIKDPLGLNNYALSKLAKLQTDENTELYNGYFMTKDNKNLFLYLSLAYPSNDSKKNKLLSDGIDELLLNLAKTEHYNAINVDFFGSPIVSVSNISQIKKDTLYTTIAALLLIFVVLYLYFRKLHTLLLLFVPVVFGALFSFSIIYLIQGEISAIAIGAGSIVLGIAIDYSLHFFTHYRHENTIRKVVSDLTVPLTLGCTTTVGAFLCLYFLQSEALRDMGLFAAFSLVGAALCCLIVLPPILHSIKNKDKHVPSETILEKIAGFPFHKSKLLFSIIVLITLYFTLNFQPVGFETDMTKLSYMSPKIEKIESHLDEVTDYKLKSVFLISKGKSIEEALQTNASLNSKIEVLQLKSIIKKTSNPGVILLTDSVKKEKINQWKQFWTPEKLISLKTNLIQSGQKLKFNETAFTDVFHLLDKPFDSLDYSTDVLLKKYFLKDFITESTNNYQVVTILKAAQENKTAIYESFENTNNVFVLDRGSMAAMVAKVLNEDFNLILLLCSILIFGFLFLSYGRIELALLAFLPMLISWIWILGIMSLFDLKFNIVNIIICTFIFGLGDDYSIFNIDGLQQKFQYNKNVLTTYRSSIFLSAYTTLIGIGVLIFAEHPALKSIALVTVIGIFCIVIVSLVIQPYLFDVLILNRKNKKQLPYSFYSFIALLLNLIYSFICFYILIFINVLSLFKFNNKLIHFYLSGLTKLALFTESKWGEKIIVPTTFWGKLLLFKNEYIPIYLNLYHLNKSKITATDYYRGALLKNYIYKGPILEWYTIIKTKLENNYFLFNELIPKEGKIMDIGCGYGYLSYMLNLCSPNRIITGIDYDQEKINVAQNGILKNNSLNFIHGDIREMEFKPSNAFIISDVLHYIRETEQKNLIVKCLNNLNDGGVLIIRDGNSEMEQKHKGTKLTEFFSIKILGFNKVTIDELCFISKEKLMAMVSEFNVSVEIIDETKFTSNIVFIIRKK